MTVILCVKERQTDIQGRRGTSPEIVNEREKTVSHTKICVFLFLSKYYSEMSKMPILQRTIVAKLTTVFHPAVFSMYLLYKWECETAVECDLRRTSIFSGYLLMWGLKKKKELIGESSYRKLQEWKQMLPELSVSPAVQHKQNYKNSVWRWNP